jgi:hypothetical protein
MNSVDGIGKPRRIKVMNDLDKAARSVNPWTVGNRILGLDFRLRRMWVGGQRLHHGLTGVAVAGAGLAQLLSRRTQANRALAWTLAGTVLMAHDWKDRAVWFRRGSQVR